MMMDVLRTVVRRGFVEISKTGMGMWEASRALH
jgi:hypothetical protein